VPTQARISRRSILPKRIMGDALTTYTSATAQNLSNVFSGLLACGYADRKCDEKISSR